MEPLSLMAGWLALNGGAAAVHRRWQRRARTRAHADEFRRPRLPIAQAGDGQRCGWSARWSVSDGAPR